MNVHGGAENKMLGSSRIRVHCSAGGYVAESVE